ncbi:hypothetical protein KAR91_66715 [Candidatus Pacearchaeota archaeon]|nr:hypothetical protein [Candidatus Pacearchaeota archaeon]
MNTNRKAQLIELKNAYQKTFLVPVSYTRIVDDLIDAEHKRVMKTFKKKAG